MNPKQEGLCDVFGDFSAYCSGKSDGCHGDIEEILATYEGASTCENTRK
jgi:hypothetical protein